MTSVCLKASLLSHTFQSLRETFSTVNMSSDSEFSSSTELSSSFEEEDFVEDGEEMEVISNEMTPYKDEPLAEESETDAREDDKETDEDGLTPAVLEARYERRISINAWFVLF